ncbi:HDOD domain-containing protein [Myxococcota bacterium]|nr:HDOD domain-containing protein [Myxococcota bacterium]
MGTTKSTNPSYGRGVAEIDTPLLDVADVRRKLVVTFGDPAYRPPVLPKVAMECLTLSRQPDVTFDRVAKLLQQDAMLTGQVLKVAQSPVFAGHAKVTTLQQAFMRIGLETLSQLVLQVTTNAKVFRARAYQPAMERLQRHSAAVAHLSRLIARYTSIDTEYAFLCGLLHDVGLAGALIVLTEGTKTPPPIDEAWPAAFELHEEAGRRMVTEWKLPEDVFYVTSAHHAVKIGGYPHPVAATVRVADAMAERMGFGASTGLAIPHVRSMRELPYEEALAVLGLGPKQLALIDAERPRIQAQIEAL